MRWASSLLLVVLIAASVSEGLAPPARQSGQQFGWRFARSWLTVVRAFPRHVPAISPAIFAGRPVAAARARKKSKRQKKQTLAATPVKYGAEGSGGAMQLVRQGKQLQRNGDMRAAMAAYDRAAQLAAEADDQPALSRAYTAAGSLLLESGQHDATSASVERFTLAVAADPDYAAATLNLAHAHLMLGQHRRGLRVVRRFVEMHPSHPDGQRFHGHLLASIGRTQEAAAAFALAVELRPTDTESLQAWAHLLFEAPTASNEAARVTARAATGLDDAARTFVAENKAIMPLIPEMTWQNGLKVQHLQALVAVGRVGHIALEMRRQHRRMFALSCVAARRVAAWEGAMTAERRLRALLEEEKLDTLSPFPPSLDLAFALVIPLPAHKTLELAKRIGLYHFPAKPPHRRALFPPATFQGPTKRSLRVGYLSTEFGDKPVGHLTLQLLRSHLRLDSRPEDAQPIVVEPYIFQLTDEPPLVGIQAVIEQNSSGRVLHIPVPVPGREDRQASAAGKSAMARVTDELRHMDVVVEMLGWSVELLGVLASRPAPMSVSMMAFPGTRAIRHIDGLITDLVVSPPELAEAAYGEKLIWVRGSNSYHITDHRMRYPSLVLSDEVALAQPAGDFEWLKSAQSAKLKRPMVFCNFNSEWRVTEEALMIWANTLRRLPAAIFWQVSSNNAALRNIVLEFAAHGLGTNDRNRTRLHVTGKRSRSDHLAVAPVCDLHFDSLEHNAHSTGLDALWAGVPLLTTPKERFAARVGASINFALGLGTQLTPVTHSLKEYEDTAVRLGTTDPRVSYRILPQQTAPCRPVECLPLLKKRLRKARWTAPLFDATNWTYAFEQVLLENIVSE